MRSYKVTFYLLRICGNLRSGMIDQLSLDKAALQNDWIQYARKGDESEME